MISRPDVGGTSGGLQGTFSARGTTSAQNTSFLNGVNVGDPAAIGAAGFYYDFDAFDDIQVSTGAHDITVPTSGVFLNMITKTGGNKWNGSGDVHLDRRRAAGPQRSRPDLQKYGFRPERQHVGLRVGHQRRRPAGRWSQNKLRFFGSFRDWRVHQNVPVQVSQTVLDQTNITSGLGNFTWQANQNNRLTGFYSRQRYSKPNRLLNNASITVIDSTSDEEDMFDVVQGLWNSVLGKNFFIDARLGLNKILFPTYQNGGNQQSLDRQRDRHRLRQLPDRHRSATAIGIRPTRPASTTSIRRSAAGTSSSSASTTRTRSPRTRTRRVDDVTTTYTSASGAVRAAERRRCSRRR